MRLISPVSIAAVSIEDVEDVVSELPDNQKIAAVAIAIIRRVIFSLPDIPVLIYSVEKWILNQDEEDKSID